MQTGEGKTLVATLAAYLNALEGHGVHVVTVNDYLATRDSQWMGKIYEFLGLTVGVIKHGLDDEERRFAYNCDITYGTNNEFGFDYPRDNMKFQQDGLVQRELHYAIVDEVDSILIDEARTPLIISGPAEKSTQLYYHVNGVIPGLKKEADFIIDEKARSVTLTEEGVAHAEKLLKVENLYDPKNIDLLHHVQQALKAHSLFKRDVDYIVKNGEVIIVDEFTGRLMPGRRYSEGLHQALEAKENVKIEAATQTYATITLQNYFRMYDKLAGMTGTAATEAAELAQAAAETEAEKAKAINVFLEEMLASADPELGNRDVRVADVLDRAVLRIGASAAGLRPACTGSSALRLGRRSAGAGRNSRRRSSGASAAIWRSNGRWSNIQ